MESLSFADAISQWKCNRARLIIPTGFKPLDEKLGGGLPVRQITTLGAYTGQRKSELARQISRSVMVKGFRVILIDIELGADRIFERFYIQEMKMTRGQLVDDDCFTAEEHHESEELLATFSANRKMVFYTPGNMPLPDKLFETLHAKLEELYAISKEPVLLILDSIQRLSMGQNFASQRDCMMHFMGDLENFAHIHNVAVLAISELSRAPKGGIPGQDKMITSLAESRSIEYVSDVIMFLVQDKNHKEEHETAYHIVIQKNRAGEPGCVECKFVFIFPYWDMRIDADAHLALQLAVLKYFNKGPSTATDCASALGKRKSTICKIVQEFEAIKKIKPYKEKGSKCMQLVGTAWEPPEYAFSKELKGTDEDCSQEIDEEQEQNQGLLDDE